MASKLRKPAAEVFRSTARRWDDLTSPSPQLVDLSKRIFAHESRFSWSAPTTPSLPAPTVPEIAFLGRSNVGKSSLLNVLLGRKRHKLVRTSSKPGHTQALNGFSLGSDLCLVDSPGYGYRSRDEWGGLITQYLKTRTALKRTYLLIEASHGYKEADENLIKHLAATGVPFQIILTKIDKLQVKDFEAMLEYSETFLKKVGKAAIWGEVLGVSNNESRLGIRDLRASICQAAGLNAKIVDRAVAEPQKMGYTEKVRLSERAGQSRSPNQAHQAGTTI